MPITVRELADDDVVDLAVTTLPDQPVSGAIAFSMLLGNKSRYVAGAQRLVQRYLLTLFTKRGSVPDDPEFGTSLFNDLPIGGAFTQAQIVHGFSFANAEAVAQMTDTSAPKEDQLVDAQLSEIDIVGTSVSLVIKLVTAAGDAIVFITPVG